MGGTEQLRFHRGWIGSQVWPTMYLPGDVYPVILCVLCILGVQPTEHCVNDVQCLLLIAPNDDTVYFADYQTKRAREPTKQVTWSGGRIVCFSVATKLRLQR